MSVTALVTSGVTVPVFGFGIRPRGPRMRAIRPTLAIWSGRGDRGVEVEPATLDAGDQVVGADRVGAGGLGLGGLVAGGEHDHAGGLAGAVRQVDRAADHLVGLARVDAEPHGDLDGGVHLAWRGLLGQLGGLERGCRAASRSICSAALR